MNDYQKPSVALQTLKRHPNSRRRTLLPNIIHFRYHFQVTWPFFTMAPRDHPTCDRVLTSCDHQSLTPTNHCKFLYLRKVIFYTKTTVSNAVFVTCRGLIDECQLAENSHSKQCRRELPQKL